MNIKELLRGKSRFQIETDLKILSTVKELKLVIASGDIKKDFGEMNKLLDTGDWILLKLNPMVLGRVK